MRRAILVVILMLVINGCSMSFNVLKHDEDKAIDIANQFLLSVIQGDYKSGYDNQTNDCLKQATPFEKFVSGMNDITRVYGAPKQASFDYFQPIPGQRAIQLIYKVRHEREGIVQYIFYLVGDAEAGYKISGFRFGSRGQNPQPYVISNARMGDDIFAEVDAKGINKTGHR